MIGSQRRYLSCNWSQHDHIFIKLYKLNAITIVIMFIESNLLVSSHLFIQSPICIHDADFSHLFEYFLFIRLLFQITIVRRLFSYYFNVPRKYNYKYKKLNITIYHKSVLSLLLVLLISKWNQLLTTHS